MTNIEFNDNHLALSPYCLGGCKVFALDAASAVHDLDPYVNPQDAVLQETMPSLGLADRAIRTCGVRACCRCCARDASSSTGQPRRMCGARRAGSVQGARVRAAHACDAAVLAMTDGFYRLVDPYERYTIEELAQRCRSCGLAALMDESRAFEPARAFRTTCGQRRRRRLGAPVDEFPLPHLKENE